ncbi:MAG: PilZ domain-containing protein [Acidobacteria bacterium]|nr:PilZ domain-containing protein [Acidobacteriota bacterium]
MQRLLSRVLVVDDADLFRLLETSFLKRLGCEIVRATDGADVIRKAAAHGPDLILLDADTPGLDGEACVRNLKSDPALRSIPVLVVAGADGVAGCCAAGADVALQSPLAGGALELALSSLGRAGHRRGQRRGARGWVRVAGPQGMRRVRLKDISRSGLFLNLSEPLPLESPVALSLRLPGPSGERPLRVRGVVVRQVPDDPDSHLIPGVGVRFVEIDARDEERIDHYVRQSVHGPADEDDSEDAGGRPE